MKKYLLAIAIVIVSGAIFWQFRQPDIIIIANFAECVAAGNPVMESYPRQCRANNQTFAELVGNELEKINLIRLSTPRPNEIIKNPLIVRGEARGFWFFEAGFPVILTDWDGRIIGQGIATAEKEWMTEEFVPFSATVKFTDPTYKNNGSLILKKDNPSGLPEHDDALEIPIFFETVLPPTDENI